MELTFFGNNIHTVAKSFADLEPGDNLYTLSPDGKVSKAEFIKGQYSGNTLILRTNIGNWVVGKDAANDFFDSYLSDRGSYTSFFWAASTDEQYLQHWAKDHVKFE